MLPGAPRTSSLPRPSEIRSCGFALTGAAASVVWILVNHSLLATMLRLARGTSYRESGLFSPKTMAMDLVVASLGVALASFWRSNPWLMPAVIAPLVVSHRSLSILSLLRDSEDRFRAMFESAAIGTGVLDLQGRIVTSNRALEEMLGFTKDELETQDGRRAHASRGSPSRARALRCARGGKA